MSSLQTLKFPQLLKAAGFFDAEPISDTPVNVWQVSIRTQLGPAQKFIVHLTGDTPASSASALPPCLKRLGIPPSECFGVLEETYDGEPEAARSRFGLTAVFSRRRLLLNAIRPSVVRNADEKLADREFVEPQLRVNGARERLDALKELEHWLHGRKSFSEGNDPVGLLFADAGIGKTTVVRRLYRRLVKASDLVASCLERIPVLLEPNHWKRLGTGANVTLWDIWREALYGTGLSLATEEQFQVCIQEGLLLPILDGFDELCQWRGARFQPEETLAQLFDLVQPSGRVLLTSRNGFWQEALDEQSRQRCVQFSLCSFDRPRRDKFFENRFRTDFEGRATAKNLQQQLERHLYRSRLSGYPSPDERITAIPAVLELVAESATGCAEQTPMSEAGGGLLDELLLHLCRREQTRQGLRLSPTDQLTFFQMLAIENKQVFNQIGDLDVYAEEFPSLRDETQFRLILAPHPFLVRAAEGQYSFRFDFLRDAFAARWLRTTGPAEPTIAARVLDDHAQSGSALVEYLAQRVELGPAGDTFLQNMWEAAHARSQAQMAVLLLVLACRAPQGNRAARAGALCDVLFPERELREVLVTGQLSGIDFSGLRFQKCVFENCTFSHCSFDRASVFSDCSFRGVVSFDCCRGQQTIRLDRAEFQSTEAREAFADKDSRRSVVDETVIRTAFRDALLRFAGAGGFVSIDYDLRNRGRLTRSPVREDVWDALQKCQVLERHLIAGLGAGRGLSVVTESMRAVRQFLDQGIETGQVRSAIDVVAQRWKE